MVLVLCVCTEVFRLVVQAKLKCACAFTYAFFVGLMRLPVSSVSLTEANKWSEKLQKVVRVYLLGEYTG